MLPLANLLTKLLKKNAFKWSKSTQYAFEAFKFALVSEPVPVVPTFQDFYYGNECFKGWLAFVP